MKKITLAFLFLGAFVVKAQDVKNDSIKTVSVDSLKEKVIRLSALRQFLVFEVLRMDEFQKRIAE